MDLGKGENDMSGCEPVYFEWPGTLPKAMLYGGNVLEAVGDVRLQETR